MLLNCYLTLMILATYGVFTNDLTTKTSHIFKPNLLDKVSDFADIIEPIESQLESSFDEFDSEHRGNKQARSVDEDILQARSDEEEGGGGEIAETESEAELEEVETDRIVPRKVEKHKKKISRLMKKYHGGKKRYHPEIAKLKKARKFKGNKFRKFHSRLGADPRRKRKKLLRRKRLFRRYFHSNPSLDDLAKYDDFLKMRNYAATFIIIPPTLKPATQKPLEWDNFFLSTRGMAAGVHTFRQFDFGRTTQKLVYPPNKLFEIVMPSSKDVKKSVLDNIPTVTQFETLAEFPDANKLYKEDIVNKAVLPAFVTPFTMMYQPLTEYFSKVPATSPRASTTFSTLPSQGHKKRDPVSWEKTMEMTVNMETKRAASNADCVKGGKSPLDGIVGDGDYSDVDMAPLGGSCDPRPVSRSVCPTTCATSSTCTTPECTPPTIPCSSEVDKRQDKTEETTQKVRSKRDGQSNSNTSEKTIKKRSKSKKDCECVSCNECDKQKCSGCAHTQPLCKKTTKPTEKNHLSDGTIKKRKVEGKKKKKSCTGDDLDESSHTDINLEALTSTVNMSMFTTATDQDEGCQKRSSTSTQSTKTEVSSVSTEKTTTEKKASKKRSPQRRSLNRLKKKIRKIRSVMNAKNYDAKYVDKVISDISRNLEENVKSINIGMKKRSNNNNLGNGQRSCSDISDEETSESPTLPADLLTTVNLEKLEKGEVSTSNDEDQTSRRKKRSFYFERHPFTNQPPLVRKAKLCVDNENGDSGDCPNSGDDLLDNLMTTPDLGMLTLDEKDNYLERGCDESGNENSNESEGPPSNPSQGQESSEDKTSQSLNSGKGALSQSGKCDEDDDCDYEINVSEEECLGGANETRRSVKEVRLKKSKRVKRDTPHQNAILLNVFKCVRDSRSDIATLKKRWDDLEKQLTTKKSTPPPKKKAKTFKIHPTTHKCKSDHGRRSSVDLGHRSSVDLGPKFTTHKKQRTFNFDCLKTVTMPKSLLEIGGGPGLYSRDPDSFKKLVDVKMGHTIPPAKLSGDAKSAQSEADIGSECLQKILDMNLAEVLHPSTLPPTKCKPKFDFDSLLGKTPEKTPGESGCIRCNFEETPRPEGGIDIGKMLADMDGCLHGETPTTEEKFRRDFESDGYVTFDDMQQVRQEILKKSLENIHFHPYSQEEPLEDNINPLEGNMDRPEENSNTPEENIDLGEENMSQRDENIEDRIVDDDSMDRISRYEASQEKPYYKFVDLEPILASHDFEGLAKDYTVESADAMIEYLLSTPPTDHEYVKLSDTARFIESILPELHKELKRQASKTVIPTGKKKIKYLGFLKFKRSTAPKTFNNIANRAKRKNERKKLKNASQFPKVAKKTRRVREVSEVEEINPLERLERDAKVVNELQIILSKIMSQNGKNKKANFGRKLLQTLEEPTHKPSKKDRRFLFNWFRKKRRKKKRGWKLKKWGPRRNNNFLIQPHQNSP